MKLKKFKGTIIKIALAVSAVMLLTGCGSKDNVSNNNQNEVSILGDYELTLGPDKLAGSTSHNGFISSTGASQVNTLVLSDNNLYEYTKSVAILDEGGSDKESPIKISFKFTGEYSNDGNVVTLNIPNDCEFDENWGPLVESGHLNNSSGKYSNGDKVTCKEDQSHDPLDLFLTEYYLDSGKHDSSVVVTVNKDNSTFEYNEIANSDDE